MGRKKIAITRIQDERNRQITFSKRKAGLLKKAYELSILCDVEIAVIMITSNRKLYQYASSNMNSILIRYTEFKDPDENKTNADILDDITKKERGADNDSGEEDVNSFLLTPRTQENYRKIDQEFDHMLHQNQVSAPSRSASGPSLGSAPLGIPQVMPVTIPVTKSLQQTIHQHLALKEQRSGGGSSGQSSAPLSSAFMSPQSDLSSASPLSKDRPHGSMPPPLITPTRLQTIRNQTLKLHLPGSGRSYIPLATGSGGLSAGLSAGSHGDVEIKKSGSVSDEVDPPTKPGSKPPLRVYIPGQKEFVPRTQSTSPLPQVPLSTSTTSVQPTTTTTAVDSLTTPVLNLQTPSLYSNLSNLPPMLSSFLGDFPFSQPPASSSATGGDSSSAALVAFPVSIQPSGGTGPGNLILHAQNMGQPFLLTPSVDGRQNSVQSFTPPTSGLAANMSPNVKDFEQLKAQYERTQQLIHQQLLFSQMQSMLQHTSRATPTSGTQTTPLSIQAGPTADIDSGLRGQESEAERYINGADVMMGGEGGRGGASEEPLPKRSRLDTSPSSIVQV